MASMPPPSYDIKGVRELSRAMRLLMGQNAQAMHRALTRAGFLVSREAVRNAPRSPTKAQANAAKTAKGVKVRPRKRDASGRFLGGTGTAGKRPGGLERSITFAVSNGQARVFVANGSEAHLYANYIHNQKGKLWFKRGPGTVAKGARADHKFILRALEDSQENITKIFKQEMKKVGL